MKILFLHRVSSRFRHSFQLGAGADVEIRECLMKTQRDASRDSLPSRSSAVSSPDLFSRWSCASLESTFRNEMLSYRLRSLMRSNPPQLSAPIANFKAKRKTKPMRHEEDGSRVPRET